MTMPILRTGLEFTADRPISWRFFVTALDRFGLGAFSRIIRIWRDQAWLDELPDYLLRDIGISRSEISSATRFGKDGPRLWI
jgi:uncharacterized protein DUF1127